MHGLSLKHLIISIIFTWILILTFVKSEEVLSDNRKVAAFDKGKFDKYAVLFKDFLKIVGKKFFIKSIAGLAGGHHNSDNGALKVAARSKYFLSETLFTYQI